MYLQISEIVILCVLSGNESAKLHLLYYKRFKRKPTRGNGTWKMRAVMLVLQQQTPFAACQMHLAVSLFLSVSRFHVLKYIF